MLMVILIIILLQGFDNTDSKDDVSNKLGDNSNSLDDVEVSLTI